QTLDQGSRLVNAPADASGSPVQQVGRAANALIEPITDGLTQTAGQAGARTGLGQPVGELVVGVGSAVQQLGLGVQGDGTQPIGSPLGQGVNNVGGAVVGVGQALGGTAGGGGGALAPVVGVVGGLTS